MKEQTNLLMNEELEVPENLTHIPDVEWCYQFFDNDPVVFGFCKDEGKATPLILELRPVEEDVLAFTHNGMVFKIFPRPISEEAKRLRNEQNQSQNAG